MRRCPTCGEEVLERAVACHRCHSLLPEQGSPSAGVSARHPRRAARLGLLALSLAALATVAVQAWRSVRADGCEPRRWVDWHVAVRRNCLSPDYVCRNMTSAHMLSDPEVAAGYRGALAAGRDASLDLSDMVERMRESFGCSPDPGESAGPPSHLRLPEGHPPIADQLPPGHPPIDGRLPPGHPPVGARLPPGHPPIDDLSPSFEPPSSIDL
jgi:hypothetical protein